MPESYPSRILPLLAAGAVTALVGTAAAAPQPLGLVATDAPQELQCIDGACHGYLSALCLVRDRETPTPGHAYAPLDRSDVKLILTRKDGSIEERPAGDAARFSAHRGYSTVRVDLSRSGTDSSDIASASIVVEPLATLLPEARDGDADPITEAEITHVVEPYRRRAADFFETSGPLSDAARITGYLVNALPEARHTADADVEHAWMRVVSASERKWAPEGVSGARSLLDECKGYYERGQTIDVRGCLALRHQRMMTDINETFWESLAAY